MNQALHRPIEQRSTRGRGQTIAQSQILVRRELVEAMHGATFTPRARCGNRHCLYVLAEHEILQGFGDDSQDFTTVCPRCAARVSPRMRAFSRAGSVDLVLYRPAQTLEQIRLLVGTPLDEFRQLFASAYYSAVLYFGGLKQAFKEIGLTYAYQADIDWRKYVPPFLGKLPDAVIARLVGTRKDAVRRFRDRHGIHAYRHRVVATASI